MIWHAPLSCECAWEVGTALEELLEAIAESKSYVFSCSLDLPRTFIH